jgi:hypothetical protein
LKSTIVFFPSSSLNLYIGGRQCGFFFFYINDSVGFGYGERGRVEEDEDEERERETNVGERKGGRPGFGMREEV